MNKAPAGTITTRADNSQWQAPVDPKAEWKQVKDGTSTPQSKQKPMQVEGVGGANEQALGHRLLRSKYDLDGYSPSDEVHPDHVDVDSEGDIDGKPVLSWQHEGRTQRSYTTNFHQRKHRHQFAAIAANAPALTNAPAALLERYNASESDGDRYLAAYFMVENGHTADQMLGVQVGHVGTSLMKASRSSGKTVLLRHATGSMFQWQTKSPALAAHIRKRAGGSPTSPLFLCGPDCISSALSEVGLGDVGMSTIRAHAQARLAVDLLSKAKRIKLDSLGAGLDKVRGNIAEASQKIAEFYGHPQAPANMAYVPPHVQAAYLESCGGGTVFKNTYNALNMRKSVAGREEELLWQHAENQVMKSIPAAVPWTEIPTLVRTLFEALKPNQTSILSKLLSTPSTEEAVTKAKSAPSLPQTTAAGLDQTMEAETQALVTSQQHHSTPPKTQATESSDLTQTSDSPGPLPTSSPTTTKSPPQGSPTEAQTSTPSQSGTSGPSLDDPSSSTRVTTSQESETLTRSSLPSKSTRVFDTAGCADLMAALLVKGAQGIIGDSGLSYFKDAYSSIDDDASALSFLAAVASFVAVAAETEHVMKSGSIAGTRGDPLGRVATHADGSRWRKVGFGKWERVGDDGKKKKPANAGPVIKERDSIQVSMLRDRVKSLRDRWHAATSDAQKASVVKELTTIKATIRQMASAGVKKSAQPIPDGAPEFLMEVGFQLDEWKEELFKAREDEGWVRPPTSVMEAARHYMRSTHKSGDHHAHTHILKAAARGEPISPQSIRALHAVCADDMTHIDKVGGSTVFTWLNRHVPRLTVSTYTPLPLADITKAAAEFKLPPLATEYIRGYIQEGDHYDVFNKLDAHHYVARIASDGSGATTELRASLVTHGYERTVDIISGILKEVRNG
jgi:hypothetical protein